MAQKKNPIDDCLTWIADEQLIHEQTEYGGNRKSVHDALTEQQRRTRVVTDYGKEVDKAAKSTKDEEEKTNLSTSYGNLTVTAKKREECLTQVAQIADLEETFGRVSTELAECATSLAGSCGHQKPPEGTPESSPTGVARSAQNCILAVHNNWKWISQLVKCTDIHLQHATEYHKFFHDVKEYGQWMPSELKKADDLLKMIDVPQNPDAQTVSRIFFELKTVLAMFLHWQYKLDDLLDRSRKVVPVHYRVKKVDHFKPITSLCNYKTKEINVREGEELTLLDNTHKDSWLVRNMHDTESQVPSVICVIPPPDPNAVDAAIKVRLQLLSIWTNALRRIGQTVIAFLQTILRDWTPEEEKLISALSDEEKADVHRMLDSVQRVLSPYWSEYPGYKNLASSMDRMRHLLNQKGDPNYREEAAKRGKALIIQIETIEELLRRYGDLWKHWETYKIGVETTRHPELLLVCKDVDCMKFVEFEELLKKWHLSVDSDADKDKDKNKKGLDLQDGMQEVEEEMITQENVQEIESSIPNGSRAEEEVYNIERAKETAEADSLRTSEQEESQTFVITGVIDQLTGNEISLEQAVKEGIINQQKGTYTDLKLKESYPIPVAMNAGYIKVEVVTSKRSEEKRRDIGLITIKTQKESRPYTVKGVIDAKTEKQLNIDDAMAKGLLDLKGGTMKNTLTDQTMNLSDALDSGLLVVEFDKDAEVVDPEIVTKTYAVHAVVDLQKKKRVTFSEAVKMGLIDQDTGNYYDNKNKENIYIGDAIKRGLVKATVVKDPNSMDIAPENRMVFSKLQDVKQKLMKPAFALSALKKAGQNGSKNSTNGKSTHEDKTLTPASGTNENDENFNTIPANIHADMALSSTTHTNLPYFGNTNTPFTYNENGSITFSHPSPKISTSREYPKGFYLYLEDDYPSANHSDFLDQMRKEWSELTQKANSRCQRNKTDNTFMVAQPKATTEQTTETNEFLSSFNFFSTNGREDRMLKSISSIEDFVSEFVGESPDEITLNWESHPFEEMDKSMQHTRGRVSNPMLGQQNRDETGKRKEQAYLKSYNPEDRHKTHSFLDKGKSGSENVLPKTSIMHESDNTRPLKQQNLQGQPIRVTTENGSGDGQHSMHLTADPVSQPGIKIHTKSGDSKTFKPDGNISKRQTYKGIQEQDSREIKPMDRADYNTQKQYGIEHVENSDLKNLSKSDIYPPRQNILGGDDKTLDATVPSHVSDKNEHRQRGIEIKDELEFPKSIIGYESSKPSLDGEEKYKCGDETSAENISPGKIDDNAGLYNPQKNMPLQRLSMQDASTQSDASMQSGMSQMYPSATRGEHKMIQTSEADFESYTDTSVEDLSLLLQSLSITESPKHDKDNGSRDSSLAEAEIHAKDNGSRDSPLVETEIHAKNIVARDSTLAETEISALELDEDGSLQPEEEKVKGSSEEDGSKRSRYETVRRKQISQGKSVYDSGSGSGSEGTDGKLVYGALLRGKEAKMGMREKPIDKGRSIPVGKDSQEEPMHEPQKEDENNSKELMHVTRSLMERELDKTAACEAESVDKERNCRDKNMDENDFFPVGTDSQEDSMQGDVEKEKSLASGAGLTSRKANSQETQFLHIEGSIQGKPVTASETSQGYEKATDKTSSLRRKLESGEVSMQWGESLEFGTKSGRNITSEKDLIYTENENSGEEINFHTSSSRDIEDRSESKVLVPITHEKSVKDEECQSNVVQCDAQTQVNFEDDSGYALNKASRQLINHRYNEEMTATIENSDMDVVGHGYVSIEGDRGTGGTNMSAGVSEGVSKGISERLEGHLITERLEPEGLDDSEGEIYMKSSGSEGRNRSILAAKRTMMLRKIIGKKNNNDALKDDSTVDEVSEGLGYYNSGVISRWQTEAEGQENSRSRMLAMASTRGLESAAYLDDTDSFNCHHLGTHRMTEYLHLESGGEERLEMWCGSKSSWGRLCCACLPLQCLMLLLLGLACLLPMSHDECSANSLENTLAFLLRHKHGPPPF